MRNNHNEAISLLERGAPWESINELFPTDAATAKFLAIYFATTLSAPSSMNSVSAPATYRVTWRRAFKQQHSHPIVRLINSVLRRVEFEEIVFQTHHQFEPRAHKAIVRKLHLCSVLRILQILIGVVFSFGLFGVIAAFVAIAQEEPPQADELRYFLVPIHVCNMALLIGVGLGLMARKIIRGLSFGDIGRYGFVPTKAELLP